MLAGIGSGLAGYLTGLASLISYPALLAVGLPPVLANTTNTVGVAAIGIGSTARSYQLFLGRPRRGLALALGTALLGGIIGSALLLLGGDHVFGAIVPWLIALASVALLMSPRLRAMRGGESPRAAAIALLVLCVYCGYFGAGAGTMYMAVMMILTSESFGTHLAMKSLILSVTNLTASVVFIALGHVDWPAAIALGGGSLVGGMLGPTVQRWIPETWLRVVVAICGLGLAVWLFVR